jgi:hypothetical protein
MRLAGVIWPGRWLLSLHGLHAYDMPPWTTQGWEQRKVRELVISRMREERGLDA